MKNVTDKSAFNSIINIFAPLMLSLFTLNDVAAEGACRIPPQGKVFIGVQVSDAKPYKSGFLVSTTDSKLLFVDMEKNSVLSYLPTSFNNRAFSSRSDLAVIDKNIYYLSGANLKMSHDLGEWSDVDLPARVTRSASIMSDGTNLYYIPDSRRKIIQIFSLDPKSLIWTDLSEIINESEKLFSFEIDEKPHLSVKESLALDYENSTFQISDNKLVPTSHAVAKELLNKSQRYIQLRRTVSMVPFLIYQDSSERRYRIFDAISENQSLIAAADCQILKVSADETKVIVSNQNYSFSTIARNKAMILVAGTTFNRTKNNISTALYLSDDGNSYHDLTEDIQRTIIQYNQKNKIPFPYTYSTQSLEENPN